MSKVKRDYQFLHNLRKRLEHQLEAVNTTIGLLRQQEIESEEEESYTVIPPAQVKGLTQEKALIRLAKANGGRFKLAVARNLLLKAGLISNKKNATNIIFTVIQRSDKFERVARGEYGLKESV